MRPKPKVLVISNYAPPMSTGSPLMLGRLLDGMPKDSYVILTNRISTFLTAPKISTWLPCPYFFLGQTRRYRAAELSKMTANVKSSSPATLLTAPVDIYHISQQARNISKRERITAILATSDMGIFLLGSYFAARATKLPFFIYLFDLYADNAFSWPVQRVARFFEPKLFARATNIFVTNRHTQEYFLRKYPWLSDKFIIMPHPTPKLSPPASHPQSDSKRIVYAGAIYWAQLPNLQDLVQAAQAMPNVRVGIYGPLREAEFRAKGLTGKQVETGMLSHAESIQKQREADILFLPMAFDGPSKAILKTAAPGKIAEYLALGKPILVYAPEFSHTARYAQEEGFALVVTSRDISELQAAIQKLLTDEQLCHRLISRAKETAQKHHSLATIQRRFRQVLLGQP